MARTEKVKVVLFVQGSPLYVRFDDAGCYEEFKSQVARRVLALTIVYGQDNAKIFVRPSSVDAIYEGAST